MQSCVRSIIQFSIPTYTKLWTFVPRCSQNDSKGMKIERNKAFWMIVKKATFLAGFVDYDQNFTVSKTGNKYNLI